MSIDYNDSHITSLYVSDIYRIISFLKKNIMPSAKIFAILIAIFCLENDLALSEYCYVDDRNPFLLFSTKTAYEHVHGTITDSKLPSG